MGDIPSWAVPLAINVAVAMTMLKVLSGQLKAIKDELKDLTKKFSDTREEIAALQKSDGYQDARIEKIEERVNRLADYWRQKHETKP